MLILWAGCGDGSGGDAHAPIPAAQREPTSAANGARTPAAAPSPPAAAAHAPDGRHADDPGGAAGGQARDPQLPMGGRSLLPTYRIVAHYGSVGGGALGILGQGTPEQAAQRVLAAAAPFGAGDRPVQPAMELITTVASASPGADGLYSTALTDAAVAPYLAAARTHRMLLILDLQPGRGRFLDQARRYERFLREPDVGLALDPEWKMGPDQVPGKQIGSSDAADLNEVSGWLAGVVRAHHLPQKLFIIHQFTQSMLPDRAAIQARPELATVFHIDGFGARTDKVEKYALLHARPPFFTGFKLFLTQDTNIFSPAETLTLTPPPDLITYQ
ncbi:hypothetical protein [Frankia sp. AgB32]|uniref:hypothetical protein n=1 Tax=Frankia sp. AgB32 TaxID=631119 RepID=UPI002010B39F|nr:hypothetical protein [Frankia sp. AgB32]MCK9895540.1 hypothetical protein [Frankia sp. AgB32]